MKRNTMSQEQRAELVKTALGEIKADVIFEGGLLVNVYSGEILPELCLALKGNHIAYVGPARPELIGTNTEVHKLEGRFLVPGFIDGHTHLDSMCKVKSYAEYALAYGNTTAVSEVAMIANAMGVKGVEFFLKETEGLPLKVFILAPLLFLPFRNWKPAGLSPAPFSTSSLPWKDVLVSERPIGPELLTLRNERLPSINYRT